MPPLWVQAHMNICHSPNLIDLIPKFQELPDQITDQTLIFLGTYRVHKAAVVREILLKVDICLDNKNTISIMTIPITGISRGVPSSIHSLMKDTTRGTNPLHTHLLHH